ncbi:MAG: hypothetical protein ACOY31_06155 [Bacillota bacterium]
MSIFKNWPGGEKKEDGGSGGPVKFTRKKIIWLAGAVLLGICLIVLGSGGESTPPREGGSGIETNISEPVKAEQKSLMSTEEEALSAKLKEMLEGIAGAGNVRVTVRLASSARETYATNTTTNNKNTVEKDQGGGTRTITEKSDSTQMVIAKDGKGDSPVIEMETSSRVAGVLVVADGAYDPEVNERLFNAVRVALNVDPHKILVLPGKGG